MARKTKLTAKQKRTLKTLGWQSTQEDGALMRHTNLSGNDSYLWDTESFDTALAKTYHRLSDLDVAMRNIRAELGCIS